MLNTKNLLLAAAVAGLVAGTSIARAEGEEGAAEAPKAEEGAAAPAPKHKAKKMRRAHAAKAHKAHKDACDGKNNCKGMDGGDKAAAPAGEAEHQ